MSCRHIALLAATSLIAAAAYLDTATPARGKTRAPSQGIDSRGEGDSFSLHDHRSGREAEHKAANPQTVIYVPIPACPGNSPVGENNPTCPEAQELCIDTSDPEDVLYWLYSIPAGKAQTEINNWTLTRWYCGSPTEASAVPAFTAEDFRRLRLPATPVHIQPVNRRTLVNIETNVYTEPRRLTRRTALLGIPLTVRATPVRYTWKFGDGAELTTRSPGAPYPDLDTTHVYRAPGQHAVTLTTTYSGEYSFDGDTWIEIDGTASATTPPVDLEVLGAQPRLVQGQPSG